ncbi:MAG: Gfo/Idh/MocA family oxidoreductase [Pirellulales bacterium]
MLRVGLVGVGFMGWIHYLAYRRSNQAKLVAFASRDAAKRAGDWSTIRGNFGPPGEKIPLDGLNAVESLDDLLADPDIDLIDVCLPPHMHVETVCKSLAAGKHVLCEKPLGLNTEECDRILEAAASAGRMVLTAQVLPYMGQYQYVYRKLSDLGLGKPIGGHFKRVISPPDWIPDFYEADKVGGPLIDLMVHDAHFVRLTLGNPKRVACIAEMKDGVVKFCHSLLQFDDPRIAVSISGGVSNQSGRPFTHGFEMQFEKGTVQFELAALTDGLDVMPLKILTSSGQVVRPQLQAADDIDAFRQEIDDAASSIASGHIEPRLSSVIARDAIHICRCLQESAATGRWIDC